MRCEACYGGPFFNMCIGIGVSFFVATSNEGGPIGIKMGRTDMRLPTTLAFSSGWLMCAIAPLHNAAADPALACRSQPVLARAA